jgi:outer membrane murein-binding lipoprotein Lpp
MMGGHRTWRLTMAAKSSKSKKKSGSKTVDELSAQVKALRSKVSSLEDEAEAWKKKAEKQRSRAKKIAKQAEKAIASATSKALDRAGKAREIAIDHAPAAAKPYLDRPDTTWTVTRLRSMAREQGVAGYSRMPKDKLLASLTR